MNSSSPASDTGPYHGTVSPWRSRNCRRLPVPTQAPLLALIAEAQHDPGTADRFHERFVGPRREQERAMLTRALEAGQISPPLGPDATIDALLGPIVYRALTGTSTPHALVEALVDDLLRPGTLLKPGTN